MIFVDSHCHIHFSDLRAQLPDILSRMEQNNVVHALSVSVELEEFENLKSLLNESEKISISVGVHPDYEKIQEPTVDELVSHAQHPRVIAIGETGLDYFRMKDIPYEKLEWQRERFRTHIRAANQIHKPLIIHTRAAAEDTIKIMHEENADSGVMHCFTESWEIAKQAIDLGFYISFSGIVTFKNAKEVQEVAQKVPLHRLLIETDSPYLAPVPYRGKTNEPSYVRHVAEFLAKLRNEPLEKIAEQTTQNFSDLFKIKLSS